jgi:Tfp pilus assembly protein PilF
MQEDAITKGQSAIMNALGILKKRPRYTDAQHGIAIIYKIIGNRKKAAEAYKKILACLKEEWGYSKDDSPYLEVERKMIDLLK